MKIDEKEFKEDEKDKFPEKEYCKLILDKIKNKCLDKQINYKFSIDEFYNKCCFLTINDLYLIPENDNIINYIKDTLKTIKNSNILEENEKNNYYQIKIFLERFEGIKNSLRDKINSNLSNAYIFENESIQTISFIQNHLFSQLIQKEEYFNVHINYLIYGDFTTILCEKILKLYKKNTMKSFKSLIHFLSSDMNNEIYKTLELIFPYDKFYRNINKNIVYWINLIIRFHKIKRKIEFQIQKENFIFDFNDDLFENHFSPKLIFKDNDNSFELTNESYISIKKKNDKREKKIDKKYLNKIYNYQSFTINFYNYCLSFSNNPNEFFDESKDNNYIIKNIENEFLDKCFSIKSLFTEKSSLIGKIWSIIYNLKKEIIDYCIEFSLDIESQLLKFLYSEFMSIENKQESLLNFTHSIKKIHLENTILWKIISIYSKNNYKILDEPNIEQKLNDFMNSCKEEIERLNNSYEIKGWTFEEWKNSLKYFYEICKRKNQRLRIDKETLKDIERLENLKKKLYLLKNMVIIFIKNF